METDRFPGGRDKKEGEAGRVGEPKQLLRVGTGLTGT